MNYLSIIEKFNLFFRLAYGFGSQPEYQKGMLALQEEDPTDGIDLGQLWNNFSVLSIQELRN